jgi:Uma2 family endonuclease
MSILTSPPLTLADLLHRLGDISPVRFQPLPGTATVADVEANKLCELIDGVLVEKAIGFRESVLTIALGALLHQFVRDLNLGLVFGADSPFLLAKSRVRLPDLALVSWDRLPAGKVPDVAILDLAPDLAIEILSRGNTRREMAIKCRDFFRAGVRHVWLINPRRRTVRVLASLRQSITLTEADTLTGDPVLPGFTLPVRDLFAELDQKR